MSFLDKLGGIAKNIGDKTGDMLAVNKLNSKIHAEQQAAAEELRKIGEYSYGLFLSDGQTAPEIAEFCQSAKSHYDEAAQAQAEIDRIRAEAEAARAVQTAAQTPAAPDGTVCPSCGTANTAGTKFCCQCGAQLEAGAPVICPQCGASAAPGVKFCPECGAPLSRQSE